LFNTRIYSHSYNPGGICIQVADSQADWSTSGQQGYLGWTYGYYNKTADATPGYQLDDFTPFPHDGRGWGPADFWDGNSWNWSPDPAPWDSIGRTMVVPNGTNTFVSEEHWVIRRWLSSLNGTLRVDWFTRKSNPFGTGVTGKILHQGFEEDSAATANQTGFRRSVSFSGVHIGDAIDLPLTPVGPNADGDDGADGSENGMTIYSCTNVLDAVTTDVRTQMQFVNSSAYLRKRFDVPDLTCLDQVRLRIRYDDGIVIWLNGVEIARRNAPVTVTWNSRSTANRGTAEVLASEPIDLTPFKGLLVPSGNVLAIQGINRSIDDSDFLVAPEITASVLPPEIIAHPASRTNLLDQTASFAVAVHSCVDVTHQWRSNGVPIEGATTATLLISAQLENQAGYDVVVSNSAGSMTSTVAVLSVNRNPLAVDHGVAAPVNTSILLPVRKLLNNDTDPDGDPFSVVAVGSPSAHGGNVLLSGNNVMYTPGVDFIGNDSFTYTIADTRGGSATAMVQVFVYSGSLPTQNQVLIIPVSGGQLVRFAGVPGQRYTLQRTLSMTPPVNWTALQTLTAPSFGIMDCVDLNNSPTAFYRTLPAP
jgi:hypothetical protein